MSEAAFEVGVEGGSPGLEAGAPFPQEVGQNRRQAGGRNTGILAALEGRCPDYMSVLRFAERSCNDDNAVRRWGGPSM